MSALIEWPTATEFGIKMLQGDTENTSKRLFKKKLYFLKLIFKLIF